MKNTLRKISSVALAMFLSLQNISTNYVVYATEEDNDTSSDVNDGAIDKQEQDEIVDNETSEEDENSHKEETDESQNFDIVIKEVQSNITEHSNEQGEPDSNSEEDNILEDEEEGIRIDLPDELLNQNIELKIEEIEQEQLTEYLTIIDVDSADVIYAADIALINTDTEEEIAEDEFESVTVTFTLDSEPEYEIEVYRINEDADEDEEKYTVLESEIKIDEESEEIEIYELVYETDHFTPFILTKKTQNEEQDLDTNLDESEGEEDDGERPSSFFVEKNKVRIELPISLQERNFQIKLDEISDTDLSNYLEMIQKENSIFASNISLVDENDEEISSELFDKATVTITLDTIPEGNVAVYRIDNTEEISNFTKLQAYIVTNNDSIETTQCEVVFETEHFTPFIIASDDSEEHDTVKMSFEVVWEGQSLGSAKELETRPEKLDVKLQSRRKGQANEDWTDVPGESYEINCTDTVDDKTATTWGPYIIEDLPVKNENDETLEYRIVQETYIPAYNSTSDNTDASTYDEETHTFNQVLRNTYMEGWNYKVDLSWANEDGEAKYHKYYESSDNNVVNTVALVSVSTQKTYDSGKLTFKIPLYLFANTENEEKRYAYGKMSEVGLGERSNPTSTESFTYYVDNKGTSDPLDDEIVFYNYLPVPAGINFSTTINYRFYMANVEDYTVGKLKLDATGQYTEQAQEEKLESNTIDYKIDNGHRLTGSGGIKAEILYSNTVESKLGKSYKDSVDKWEFDKYVYVLYSTNTNNSYQSVTFNQDFTTELRMKPGEGGEVIAARYNGSYADKTHYNVEFDQDTGEYFFVNNIKRRQSYIYSQSTGVTHSFVVRYKKIGCANEYSASYTLDTTSANVHEKDKEGYLEGTKTEDPNLLPKDIDNYEYGHIESSVGTVKYSDYQYVNTGDISQEKNRRISAAKGSLTKLEGGLDADDSFEVRAYANGYYTGPSTTTVSDDGCTYTTVAHRNGRYPNGYKLTIIDDVLEVHARNKNGTQISENIHLTEEDYELNKTTAPYVNYTWISGVDFSTGQGATTTRTDQPFKLYAKTKTNGEWIFVQDGYDTNKNGRVEFPEAVGKGYVAYKVESPHFDGTTYMYLYNIAVTYKASSKLLKEMADKSDMSLEDYIHTLYVYNVAAVRIDVKNEDGTYTLVNPYTGSKTGLIYGTDRNQLNVEKYVHSDDQNLTRYYASDILTRASGTSGSGKYMQSKINPSSKTVDLMNRLYVYQSYNGITGEFGKDVDDKNELREVVFYDLLPEGYSYNREKPVYVYTNTTINYFGSSNSYREDKYGGQSIPSNSDAVEALITNTEVIEDYQGSGRQMVIFHVKAPDNVSTWKDYSSNHYSMFTLTFYATGAYGDVNNGTPSYNFMSVQKEDGSNFLGNGSASNVDITRDSTLYRDDGKTLVDYTDVNKEGNANTLYSYTYVSQSYLSSYEAGIKKNVKGYSGMWGLQDQVLLDHDYRYRIKYGTTSGTTKNIVIYDILETAINSDGASGEPGMWQGTYVSSNVKSLRQKGIDVKIWYSVQSGLLYDDFKDTEYLPEHEPDVWTDVEPEDKSTIKAVAYDLRKKTDGTDFVLEPYNEISFEIVMHAPEDLQKFQWAYNLVAYNSTFIDSANNVMSSFNQSNRVKVELNKYCALNFEKYYYASVGAVREPLANTEFSLYKCTSEEDNHTHTGKPGETDSCWKYFQKVITDENGNAAFTNLLNGKYAIVETGTVDGFMAPNAYWTFNVDSTMGAVTDPETNQLIVNDENSINFEHHDDGTYSIMNERELTSVQVNKVWDAPSSQIPSSLKVTLNRDGEYLTEYTLTAEDNWSHTFADLYKYSLTDGHLYNYTIEEEGVDSFVQIAEEKNIKASGNIKLTFDEKTKSYNSNDALRVYYKPEGSNRFVYVSRSGSGTWSPIVLPSVDDYYFYWLTDASNTNWGFAIDSVEDTTDAVSTYSTTYITDPNSIRANVEIEEVNDISYIQSEHEYGNNEHQIWHITGLGGPGKSVTLTNTRLAQLDVHKDVPYQADNTEFNFEVTFTVDETVDDVLTAVPVTQYLHVQKYATRDSETYTPLVLTPDENGKVTFTLKNQEWVRFTDLPIGTKYVISEEDIASYSESFAEENEDGDISDLNQGVYLKLNNNSLTESTSYDFFAIYYKVGEQWYVVYNDVAKAVKSEGTYNAWRFGGSGNTMGVNHTNGIFVPTTDFYVAWRSDTSAVRYGFEFDSVEVVPLTESLDSYAAAHDIPVSGINSSVFGTPEHIETSNVKEDVKTNHQYSDNEKTIWHVRLFNAGQNEIAGQTDTSVISSIRATNEKYTSFSFTKVNIENDIVTPLSDVKFALYKCVNTSESHTHSENITGQGSCYQLVEEDITSAENGLVTLQNLLNGHYALKETSAKNGIVIPNGYWTFDVVNGSLVETPTTHPATDDDEIFNFTATESGTYVLNNTLEKIDVVTNKKWNSAATDIPQSITVNLFQNGAQIATKQVSANDRWTTTFSDLPKYDFDGNEYEYVVNEEPISGYVSTSQSFTGERLKIRFASESKSENNNDYLYVYYKMPEDQNYSYVRRTGTSTWADIVIPNGADYYFYWHTNSYTTYWGFEIEEITVTNDELTAATKVNTIPNYEIIEVDSITDIKTAHQYVNNDNKLWHFSNTIPNTLTYEFTNTRLGYFDVHKEVRFSDTEEEFPFAVTFMNQEGIPYTNAVTYHKYQKRNATEYTIETVTPNDDGIVEFGLSHDEWVRFIDLPLDLNYVVNEQLAESSSFNAYSGLENENNTYDIANKGVYLKVKEGSTTESTSYDYFAIYYKVGEQWYVVYNDVRGATKNEGNNDAWRFGGSGNTMGINHTNGIYVPTTDFYVAWRSDGSQTRNGFEFESIELVTATETLEAYAAAHDIPVSRIHSNFGSPAIVETTDVLNDVKTNHPYSNNERKIWHVTSLASGMKKGNYSGTTSSTDSTSIRFVNVDITTQFKLTIEKEIEGDVPSGAEREFLFNIDRITEGAPLPEETTIAITGENTNQFGPITYTSEGTYQYKISESQKNGVNYDNYTFAKDRTVTVNVKLGGDGLLHATWVDDTDSNNLIEKQNIIFTNKYKPKPVKYALSVQKQIDNVDGVSQVPELIYKYDITGIEDNGELPPMPSDTTISIRGEGTGWYPEIKFTEVGVYRYRIQEEETVEKTSTTQEYHPDVWGFDTSAHEVVIEVRDNAGQLEVYSYLDDDSETTVQPLTITNIYDPVDALLELGVTKSFTDNGQFRPNGETFYFTLTAGNSEDNNKKEINTPMPVGSSENAKTVQVHLTDQGGNHNDAGSTIFGLIEFKTEGTYRYTIHEERPNPLPKGYTYDDTKYDVTVIVSHMEKTETGIFHYDIDAKLSYKDENNVIQTIDITPEKDESGNYTTSIAGKAVFTNTYEPIPVDVTLPVSKTILGSNRTTEKDFTFTVTGNDTASTQIIQTGTTSITDEGKSTDLKLHFTKAGTYTYTVSEIKPDPVPKGYEYSEDIYTVTIKVTDESGELKAEVSKLLNGKVVTDEVMNFTNSYAPEITDVQLSVEKEITGHVRPSEKEFTFNLIGKTGNDPLPVNTTVKVTGEGNSEFEKIEFHESGVYEYTLQEVDGNQPGYTYVTNPKNIKITVTDDDGTLSAEIEIDGVKSTDAKATFSNHYEPMKTDISIPVTKQFTLDSHDRPTEQTFMFRLEGNNLPDGYKEISIVGDGTESFENIEFTKEGTYTYTISEVIPSPVPTGYTYDNSKYNVVVTVTDNDGYLTAKTEFEKENQNVNAIVFENKYIPEETSIKIPVHKNYVSNKIGVDEQYPNETFEFDISRETINAPLPSKTSVQVTGEGDGNFEKITFNSAGIYKYRVKENQTDKTYTHWDLDQNEYEVTVTVVDENGKLSASYETDEDTSNIVSFTNTYTPTDAKLSIPVTKKIIGNDRQEKFLKEFEFILIGVGNAPMPSNASSGVATATVKDEGDTTFGEITFSHTGKYYYDVQESVGEDTGYQYDSAKYRVEITVENDVANEALKASITQIKIDEEEKESIVFENTYTPNPVTVALPVMKEIIGTETLVKKDFTFKIVGDDENSKSTYTEDTYVLNGEGSAEEAFKLQFNDIGSYSYQVSEVAGSDHGYTYDSTVYTVEITVIDNDGALEAKTVIKNGSTTAERLSFENEYNPIPTKLAIPIEKVVEGNVPTGKDKVFNFEIKAKEIGSPIAGQSATITGNGKTTFDEIEFTHDGIFTYIITEVEGSDTGYQYSDEVFEVTVTITDDDGKLKADITNIKSNQSTNSLDEVVFKNVYQPVEAEVKLPISKVISGAETPENKIFTFQITGNNEESNSFIPENGDTTLITGEGITSNPITLKFNKAGKYSYQIHEIAGNDNGYTYDSTVYKINVTVTDHDGILQAETKVKKGLFTVGEIKFENKYNPSSVSLAIPVKKILSKDSNSQAQQLQFSFELEGENSPLPKNRKVTIVGTGETAFDEIVFDEVGTYTYFVKEINMKQENVKYDTTVFKVVVEIVDKDGRLEKNVQILNDSEIVDEISFENSYQVPSQPWNPSTPQVTTPEPTQEITIPPLPEGLDPEDWYFDEVTWTWRRRPTPNTSDKGLGRELSVFIGSISMMILSMFVIHTRKKID